MRLAESTLRAFDSLLQQQARGISAEPRTDCVLLPLADSKTTFIRTGQNGKICRCPVPTSVNSGSICRFGTDEISGTDGIRRDARTWPEHNLTLFFDLSYNAQNNLSLSAVVKQSLLHPAT